MTHKIVWKNEHKNLGIIVNEENQNYLGLSHELRKGALNTLGVVSPEFMESWGDMTADDNCIVDTVNLNAPVAGMTVEMAIEKAAELNKNGKHREEWHYYPTRHEQVGNWFVMRRRKHAEVRVAMFNTGELSGSEK